MSIPNLITLVRIALIPFWVVNLISGHYIRAIIILAVSAFSDVLDGFIARKFNMVTRLGTVLDPIADKLMQFTVFLCLAITDLIPVWLVVLLFIKEFFMAIGTFILLQKHIVIKANISGKAATVIFYTIAFVVFFLDFQKVLPRGSLTIWATCLAGVAVIAAFYAMISYAKIFFKVLKEGKEAEQ